MAGVGVGGGGVRVVVMAKGDHWCTQDSSFCDSREEVKKEEGRKKQKERRKKREFNEEVEGE